jgi:hypothetical protein
VPSEESGAVLGEKRRDPHMSSPAKLYRLNWSTEGSALQEAFIGGAPVTTAPIGNEKAVPLGDGLLVFLYRSEL